MSAPHGAASSPQQPLREFTRLSTQDTLVLKGLAIASVALLNYHHLLGPVTENEFEFASGYIDCGLTIRHWEIPESWGTFVWYQIRKIYPMFFLAVLA